QQHHVAPCLLDHGPRDRDRENVLAHSTVSRCHFSNRLYKTRSEIIDGRRRACPLLEPLTFFRGQRRATREEAVKLPRLNNPAVYAKVITRFSLQCPVFVMAVRHEADQYLQTFLARRLFFKQKTAYEMVARFLVGHSCPATERCRRLILYRVHRVSHGSDRRI